MYEEFKILLDKYLDRTISQPEMKQLAQLLELPEHQVYIASLIDENLLAGTMIGLAPEPDSDEIYHKILLATNQDPGGKAVAMQPGRRRIWKWIAAACIVLVLGLAVVGILTNNHQMKSPAVATTHDVPAPTNTRAVITLANGSKVYLDSVNTGTIAQESNVNVVKNTEGGISYLSAAGAGGMSRAGGGARRAGVDLNTLFNPRGSKVIFLTLGDGTRVWLNSESSLKYPIAFAGSTREVEITGEAYFEVKHNSKQPFQVHLPNGSTVEDIGTSFNINAYPDEDATKTTLIEGSVRLSPAGGGELRNSSNNKRPGVVLNPGQQAEVTGKGQLLTHNSVDVDETVAWKNGFFEFNNSNIQSIMKQVERWYDLDVQYQGPINQTFNGKIPRTVNASDVFKILESTGWVHFKIEGKKVIVRP